MIKILWLSIPLLLLLGFYPARFNSFLIPERKSYSEYFDHNIIYPINEDWGVTGRIFSMESGGGGFSLEKDPNHGLYLELIKFKPTNNDFLNRKVMINNFIISYQQNDSLYHFELNPKTVKIDSNFVSASVSDGYFGKIDKIDYFCFYERNFIQIPFEVKDITLEFDLIDDDKKIPVKIPLHRVAKIVLGVIGS